MAKNVTESPIIRIKNVVMVPISQLVPHPDNPNEHPKEQIERIAQIIEFQGWRRPITVSNRSGFMTVGHGRRLAALLRGWAEAPVTYQDYENEAAEYADMVADNALQEWAELDMAAINKKLPDLGPDLDIDLLGIKDFVLDPADKDKPGCDEDEVPEAAPPRSKLGDRWAIGDHVLVCGDSTDPCAVDLLMMGEKADMVFTSPPYNCGINYNEYDDTKKKADYLKFIEAILYNAFRVMNSGRLIFWNCGSSPKSHAHAHAHAMEKIGFTLRRQIIWKKTGAQIPLWQNTKKKQLARYYLPNYTHENIFMASTGEIEPGGPTNHDDMISNDVWEISQFAAGGHDHPAAFPVQLVELPILSGTTTGEALFEPFGGSGTTMIACEKTDRKCFMMEIDSHYCDVIIARWEKYTGRKAELQASGPEEGPPPEPE